MKNFYRKVKREIVLTDDIKLNVSFEDHGLVYTWGECSYGKLGLGLHHTKSFEKHTEFLRNDLCKQVTESGQLNQSSFFTYHP